MFALVQDLLEQRGVFGIELCDQGVNLGIWLRGVGGFDTVDLGKSIVFVVPVVVAGSGGVVACGNHELDDSLALVHYGVEMVRYAGCLAAFSVDAASLAISVVVIDANVVSTRRSKAGRNTRCC